MICLRRSGFYAQVYETCCLSSTLSGGASHKMEATMIKIPCLFERVFSKKSHPILLRTVTPGCEWALTNEGIATRKRDGTACLVKGGKLFKRYDVRVSRGASVPLGAIPCIPESDPVTGHWPHWVEVGSEPESKWHREAWTGIRAADGSRFRPAVALEDGTYELCGPRIGANPEDLAEHEFIKHGSERVDIVTESLSGVRDWDSIRSFLESALIEGIVFHHADGRMCKIRRDDYGFKWPVIRAEKLAYEAPSPGE